MHGPAGKVKERLGSRSNFGKSSDSFLRIPQGDVSLMHKALYLFIFTLFC